LTMMLTLGMAVCIPDSGGCREGTGDRSYSSQHLRS
jgi:hypothetical protein